jgi:hypothetical protein
VQRKALLLLTAAVALSGFTLAVFIPGASAQKSRGVYTQYCEYTQYSQYGEYCEPQTTTTVENGTTTVITSPGFTISSPSGTAPTTPNVPGIKVSADGSVSIDVKDLKPGESFTANGVAVVVLALTANGVEMSFGGVAVDVPSVASVAISKDGTVAVTSFIAGGKLVPAVILARAAAFHPLAAVGQQDIILPSGKASNSFAYVLSQGVSFGSQTTWKQVAQNFTVEATGTHALKLGTKAAQLAKVPFTVSSNPARTAVTARLAKRETSFIVKFAVGKLQYSAAERTLITAHTVRTLSPKFTVTSQQGKQRTKVPFAFTYPVA